MFMRLNSISDKFARSNIGCFGTLGRCRLLFKEKQFLYRIAFFITSVLICIFWWLTMKQRTENSLTIVRVIVAKETQEGLQ